MKNKKTITSICLAVSLLMSLFVSGTALADSRTKITSISLTIDSDYQAGIGGNVNVTSSDHTYTVSDITVTNDDGEYSGSFKPRVSIYLEAYEDYYFSSTSKSIFKFYGDDCTFVSAKRRDSGGGLDVVIKMGQIGSGDLTVTGLEWDPSSGIATWDEVAGANSYQVCLYRGSTSFSGIKSTSNRRYNFASTIDQQGNYFFRVRAVGTNSEKGEWAESEVGYISASQASDFRYSNSSGSSSSSSGSSYTGPGVASSSGPSSSSSNAGPGYSNSGSWKQDSVGWWYQLPNNSYPVNSWEYIGGKWYFFNQYGYMTVGWIQWNNNWYYCGSDGAMYVNGRTPDGHYVGGDGVWIQ